MKNIWKLQQTERATGAYLCCQGVDVVRERVGEANFSCYTAVRPQPCINVSNQQSLLCHTVNFDESQAFYRMASAQFFHELKSSTLYVGKNEKNKHGKTGPCLQQNQHKDFERPKLYPKRRKVLDCLLDTCSKFVHFIKIVQHFAISLCGQLFFCVLTNRGVE